MEIRLTREEYDKLKYFKTASYILKHVDLKIIDEFQNLEVNQTNGIYLADVAAVGDYVNYDAGFWTETKAKPTSQGQFGGYIYGTNKGISLRGCKHGWRIIRIDDGEVTLVHAGIPEYYYYGYGHSNEAIDDLNRRAMEQYLNADYAESVHMLTKEEIDVFTRENDLRCIGIPYYVATAYGTDHLWGVEYDGNLENSYYFNDSFGVRLGVELKSNILTTGQGIDCVGNEKAWQLVKTK